MACRIRDNSPCKRTPQNVRNARSVQAGLVARRGAEEESGRAVARWEAALRAGKVDEGVRKEELKAVEKLEVLLKVSKRPLGVGRQNVPTTHEEQARTPPHPHFCRHGEPHQ